MKISGNMLPKGPGTPRSLQKRLVSSRFDARSLGGGGGGGMLMVAYRLNGQVAMDPNNTTTISVVERETGVTNNRLARPFVSEAG
jgi:hypothetical protein